MYIKYFTKTQTLESIYIYTYPLYKCIFTCLPVSFAPRSHLSTTSLASGCKLLFRVPSIFCLFSAMRSTFSMTFLSALGASFIHCSALSKTWGWRECLNSWNIIVVKGWKKIVLIYEGIFFGLQNQSVNAVLCLKFKISRN